MATPANKHVLRAGSVRSAAIQQSQPVRIAWRKRRTAFMSCLSNARNVLSRESLVPFFLKKRFICRITK